MGSRPLRLIYYCIRCDKVSGHSPGSKKAFRNNHKTQQTSNYHKYASNYHKYNYCMNPNIGFRINRSKRGIYNEKRML